VTIETTDDSVLHMLTAFPETSSMNKTGQLRKVSFVEAMGMYLLF